MKKLKKKWVCIVLAMILFIMTTMSVSAHEYAQPLRWLPKTNGYAHLRLSYSGVQSGSVYLNNMTALRTAVNNSSAKILITEVSTGVNIDIRTSSENAWKTYGVPSGVAAFTLMYDTDGKRIEGYYDASGSTGKLDYANILLNPKESASGYADIAYPSSDTVQTNVLVHEVGHALGLWHCSCSLSSVMKATSSSITSYTSHDNACLNSYYGS